MNSLTLQYSVPSRRVAVHPDRQVGSSATRRNAPATRRPGAMRDGTPGEPSLIAEALMLMRDFPAAAAAPAEQFAAYPRLLLSLYRESGALASATVLPVGMAATLPVGAAADISVGLAPVAPVSTAEAHDARLVEEVRTYARKWIGEADARLTAATPQECWGIMGWYDMTYRVAYGHATPADTLLPIILRLLRTLTPADLSTRLLLTNLIDQLPASSSEGLTPALRAELAQFRTRQLTQWLREARTYRPLAAYPPAEALRIANCLCATDLRTLLPATHLPGGQDLLKSNLLTGLLPLANRLLRPLRQSALATPTATSSKSRVTSQTAETLQTYLLNLHAHVGLPDHATLRQLLHQHLSASPNPYTRTASLLATRLEEIDFNSIY